MHSNTTEISQILFGKFYAVLRNEILIYQALEWTLLLNRCKQTSRAHEWFRLQEDDDDDDTRIRSETGSKNHTTIHTRSWFNPNWAQTITKQTDRISFFISLAKTCCDAHRNTQETRWNFFFLFPNQIRSPKISTICTFNWSIKQIFSFFFFYLLPKIENKKFFIRKMC